MVYTFTVALDEECRLGRPFLFGQQWCAVDGDVLVENPFHPFYGTLISVLPDLRELLRVVYAEDMVHPSPLAVKYIFEKFKESHISSAAFKQMDDNLRLTRAENHIQK